MNTTTATFPDIDSPEVTDLFDQLRAIGGGYIDIPADTNDPAVITDPLTLLVIAALDAPVWTRPVVGPRRPPNETIRSLSTAAIARAV